MLVCLMGPHLSQDRSLQNPPFPQWCLYWSRGTGCVWVGCDLLTAAQRPRQGCVVCTPLTGHTRVCSHSPASSVLQGAVWVGVGGSMVVFLGFRPGVGCALRPLWSGQDSVVGVEVLAVSWDGFPPSSCFSQPRLGGLPPRCTPSPLAVHREEQAGTRWAWGNWAFAPGALRHLWSLEPEQGRAHR